MKSVIVFALFLTVAFATTIKVEPVYENTPTPVRNPNSGVVSMLVRASLNKETFLPRLPAGSHVSAGNFKPGSGSGRPPADLVDIEDFDIKKGFSILKEGIEVAIRKAKEGFQKMREKIRSIKLPKIDIPALIQKVINFGKVLLRLYPCAKVLQKLTPNFIKYAEEVAIGNAEAAVEELLTVLQDMPEITQACIGQPFEIPAEDMEILVCTADMIALASKLASFVLFPELVLANLGGLVNMVKMIPKTVSDCTGAFEGPTNSTTNATDTTNSTTNATNVTNFTNSSNVSLVY